MTKTLIKGGCVLTLGERTPNYAEADVLIEDGVISELGTGIRSRGAEMIDARGTIVMPGFVDGHRHAWTSLFKNAGDQVNVESVAPHYLPDDVYAATVVGLLGAAEAGITTVVDWSDLAAGPDSEQAAIQAHRDAGIRTILVTGTETATRDVGPLTTRAHGAEHHDVGRAVEGVRHAREIGWPVHLHAGTLDADEHLVSGLADSGLLGEDVTLVHCTGLTGVDFGAIARGGAKVVVTPSNEMATGLGMPPLQHMIDNRIRPGLGVDRDGIGPGDMFAQMRSCNSIQHAMLFDLKLAGKGGIPNLLNTRDVIKYATIDSSHSVGLGRQTGSLEPGKQADILILRADRPNIAPVNDPIGAVVWGMDTSNVDWVFVAGQSLIRDGVLESDRDEATAHAARARDRVIGAAGIMTMTESGAAE